MELIPILYTVLLISLGLLAVVLVYSNFSSRKEKQDIREDYKELVNQRKIAYSKEQSEYLRKINGGFELVTSEQNSQDVSEQQSESKSADSNSELSENSHIENNYFIPGKPRSHGRRRFSVLNDPGTVQKETPSSQQKKSVYPVPVKTSGNYYG